MTAIEGKLRKAFGEADDRRWMTRLRCHAACLDLLAMGQHEDGKRGSAELSEQRAADIRWALRELDPVLEGPRQVLEAPHAAE